MRYILYFIFPLLFSGCISSNIESSNIPKWYINAPQNDNLFLYGISNDYNIKIAKANALNDMASRLMVNVSSTFHQNIKTSSNIYTKDISQDIKLEVENIKFTNAKTIKNKLINNQFYVVMRVDRKDLFEETFKAFNLLDIKIEKSKIYLKEKSILEKIHYLQNLYPTLIKAKKSAYILYAINNDFNYDYYLSKYDDMIDDILKLKDLVIIDINEDKNNLFKEEFISLLNKNYFKVSNSNANVQINIKSMARDSLFKGWYISKITVTISIETNGKNISNKIFNIIGRSSSSKINALANAKFNFKNEIDKMGLDSILFN